MKNFYIKLAVSVVTILGSAFGASAQDSVDVKRTKDEKIGSWFFQCEKMTFEGKQQNEVCALVQNFAVVNKKEKGKDIPVMRLQIHKIDKEGKKITFLGIRTPLGVDLASGLKMQIAGKDYKAAPFTTCYAQPLGCRSSFLIEGQLETALKAGKDLRIGYKSLDGQVISSDIKTNGYAQGITKF